LTREDLRHLIDSALELNPEYEPVVVECLLESARRREERYRAKMVEAHQAMFASFAFLGIKKMDAGIRKTLASMALAGLKGTGLSPAEQSAKAKLEKELEE